MDVVVRKRSRNSSSLPGPGAGPKSLAEIPPGAFTLLDAWEIEVDDIKRPYLLTKEEGQAMIDSLTDEKRAVRRSIDAELQALDRFITAIARWMADAPGTTTRAPGDKTPNASGERRAATAPETIVCSVCGSPEAADARFCSVCGSPLVR